MMECSLVGYMKMELELKITLIISSSFFLVFFSAKTMRFLNTTIFEERGYFLLGFLSLSVNYLCYCIGSLTSRIVIQKIGLKVSMIIGALTYSMFNLAIFLIFIDDNVAANWVIIMTMSAINGYGSGIYWVA
jgi:hypothetical protein